MPVDHIGRYKIEAELGKGAMGVVYRATDPNIGRTVALKTLRLDVNGVESNEMLLRFQAEARNAGVLNHANIVTIYDAQEIEGTFYIAMEYIQGQTLQDLLKSGSPPIEKVIDIVRQVCAGLDYAHARGIIHRDIKPANIMIEPDDTVKIMDFGIAKGQGTGMTSTGQVLGTPNYMSPEQVKGKPLDGRSDLFSLGVVVYEMLTGERPFTGDNITTVIYKIVNEQPLAPCEVNAGLHAGLNAAVMKALSKNRDERHQSGAELTRDLENFQNFGLPSGGTTRFVTGPIEAVAAAPARAPKPVASTAGAAAAAKTARSPLSTTVALARKPAKPPAKAPPERRSIAMIVGIVGLAVLAVAGYIGLRWKSHKAQSPASAPVASAPAPKPATAAPLPTPLLDEPEKPLKANSAAPKPRVAAAPGELRITSTPPGAHFTLDGRGAPDYVTPFTASRLDPGSHTITFTASGFKPETRHVEVTPGQRSGLIVNLRAIIGFINVNSTPAAAAIFLDGSPTGVFTPGEISVSPGQHNVTVRKEGLKDQTMSAVVGADQTLPMNFTLHGGNETAASRQSSASQNVPPPNAPAPAAGQNQQKPQPEEGNPFGRVRRFFGGPEHGSVVLRTMPPGAEVWVNGRQTVRTTPLRLPAVVGRYMVGFRLPGYKPAIRNIEVEKGKTVIVDEILQKQ
jgi:predicted Ser/Thr protein kinase